MIEQNDLHAIGQIAERLSNSGFTVEQALSQVRNYAKSGYDLIQPKMIAGGGKTAPRLYSNTMLAIAAVLSELTNMGISDVDCLRAAARSMYSWHFEDEPENLQDVSAQLNPDGPMGDAVRFYLANQVMRDNSTWDFQLHVFAATNDKWQREIRGYVIDSSREQVVLPGPETGLIPRSAIVIALNPLFDRVFRDIKKFN